jgi:hypothetical protein
MRIIDLISIVLIKLCFPVLEEVLPVLRPLEKTQLRGRSSSAVLQ